MRDSQSKYQDAHVETSEALGAPSATNSTIIGLTERHLGDAYTYVLRSSDAEDGSLNTPVQNSYAIDEEALPKLPGALDAIVDAFPPRSPSAAIDPTSQIVIKYGTASYLVPWGSNVTIANFYVHNSSTGAVEQVTADVAANLYAASKAFTLLNTYFTTDNVQSNPTYWTNVYNSVASILHWQEVSDITAQASGMFLGSFLTDKPPSESTLAEAFLKTVLQFDQTETNLAAGAIVLADAATVLDNASAKFSSLLYQNFQNPQAGISATDIADIANRTLTSLSAGSAATQAIYQLGNANESFWDSALDFAEQFTDSLLGALHSGLSDLMSQLYGHTELVDETAAVASNFVSQIQYYYELKSALTNSSLQFPPLTAKGILSLEQEMANASYVSQPGGGSTSIPLVFSIVPGSAGIVETGGVLLLQISRSGTASDLAQSFSISAYTFQNYQGNGIYNQNPLTGGSAGDYYYQALSDQYGNNKFTFAPGVSTITVPIVINDLHLTSGSETFGFEIFSSSGQYLQSSSFTIFNTDAAESYRLTASALSAAENGPPLTFTVTRTGNLAAETVYVSTVDNLGVSNAGNKYYDSLSHFAVTFAAGSQSATVSVVVNDAHLTAGSESFNLIVQENATDNASDNPTYLVSAPFTILNTDSTSGTLAGNVSGTVNLTGATNITRTNVNLVGGADVRNGGTLTIGNDGFFTADMSSGNRVDNLSGATFSVQTDSSIAVETFENDGRLVVAPGSGNTAIFGGIWFPSGGGTLTSTFVDGASGAIEVDSGTLELLGGGSSSASDFNVASGAALLFRGGTPFLINGGTYNVAGTTEFGDSTGGANVVFAAGTDVDLGSNWSANNSHLDLSAVGLSGSFSSLSLTSASLLLGAYTLTIENLSMSGNSLLKDDLPITLTGHSTLSGAVSGIAVMINAGAAVLAANSQFYFQDGEAFDNTGNLTIQSSATFGDASGLFVNAAGAETDVTGSGARLSPGVLDNNGVIKLLGTTATISGFIENWGHIEADSGSLTLEGGGTLMVSGLAVDTAASLTFSAGMYDVLDESYEVAGDTIILGAATLAFDETTAINSQIENSGTIEVKDGTLTIAQPVTGTGTILMDFGTTLALGSIQDFSNAISGFTVGDTIDLVGVNATSASIDGSGTLTIRNGSSVLGTLMVTGIPAGVTDFAVASDGAGGTNIKWPGNVNSAYVFSPSPGSVSESGGSITFTVTRNGSVTAAETDYVSSITNAGTGNERDAFFGTLEKIAITFAAGSSVSSAITVNIHDLGISAGNETIGLVLQHDPSDSPDDIDMYLALTSLAIENADSPTTILSGGYSGTITETGISEVTGFADLAPADLRNSGTMTVAFSGSIGSVFGQGALLENLSGGILAIETPTDFFLETFDNAGRVIVSPGVNQVATIEGGVSGFTGHFVGTFNTTGAGTIEVDSGTLNLHIGGTATASAFSVASDATLLITSTIDDPFVISGGLFDLDGTISVGSSTHGGNLVFGSGADVNLGGMWKIYDTVDMSAAIVSGLSTSMYISGVLKLGANSVTFENLNDAGGFIAGTGTVTLAGTSYASGNWNESTIRNDGIWNIQSISLSAGAVLDNEGALIVAGGISGPANSTINNDDGATLSLTGTSLSVGTINNSGLFDISSTAQTNISNLNNTGEVRVLSDIAVLVHGGSTNASDILLETGSSLNLGGTFTFTGGALLGGAGLVNGGQLNIAASTTIDCPVSNAGTIEVLSGTLTLPEAVRYTGTIALDSGTSLALGDPGDFTNSVSGLGNQTSLDFLSAAIVSAKLNASGGLVVGTTSATLGTIALAGTPLPANTAFFIKPDESGGSDVSVLNSGAEVDNGIVSFADGSQIAVAQSSIASGGFSTTGSGDATAIDSGKLTISSNVNAIVYGSQNSIAVRSRDSITLYGDSNSVRLSGGHDTLTVIGADSHINALGGNEAINMGAHLNSNDRILGSDTNDTVILNGDYSAGLTFKAHTITGIVDLNLVGGHSYKITMNDGNVSGAQHLTVDASSLGVSDSLSFRGSHELDRRFIIFDGAGNDSLFGGNGGDRFVLEGGSDTVRGEDGNDVVDCGSTFSSTDKIDGGIGRDALNLSGDYASGVRLGPSTLINVETINLGAGFSYKLISNDATVGLGQSLTVNASQLGASSFLIFDGSHESDGRFVLIGGAGSDILQGGSGNDIITGGLGADKLFGNGGHDRFDYTSVSESTSATYDTIRDFDGQLDKFDLPVVVSGLDPIIATGALGASIFDHALSEYAGPQQLAAGHAVLFTPTAGSLAGHTFLIVDANGIAGYQASSDFVFDVTGATNLSSLKVSTFI